MMENHFWLTVHLDESEPRWPPKLESYRLEINDSITLQKCAHELRYRTSPIFPLVPNFITPKLNSCFIYFYFFDSAFPVLGRLQNIGSEKLTGSIWYNIGLASILLITDGPELNTELLSHARTAPRSIEIWKIKDSCIIDISIPVHSEITYNPQMINIPDYSGLSVADRAIIDELVSTLALIMPKIAKHIPSEFDVFTILVNQMNELITELIYLSHPQGVPPVTLEEYSEETLKNDKYLCDRIKHQVIDRLIQVNSALSYVSTQMLSGAPPILERRSLIRRHSLLGTGSALLALIRITRSIEFAFSELSTEDIITDHMAYAKPLPGIDKLPNYDCSKWRDYSINVFEEKAGRRAWYPKLPYFSGRLGYRETEYTISAAIQSLTTGASPEWSLLTITHELLHGYVRNLLSVIFLGDSKKTDENNWKEFYKSYSAIVQKKKEASSELDSLRMAILAYCCLTFTFGSITVEARLEEKNNIDKPGNVITHISDNFVLLPEDQLRIQFEGEYRNISEIFTHVLDLHYFYASRLSAYIPLIWLSWAELPHVGADLRQYILRSLLAISTKTKIDETPYNRFYASISRFKELFSTNLKGVFNVPLIHNAMRYLNDESLSEQLFYPYWASLFLVDLVNNIFVSQGIRGKLFNDPLVRWVNSEEGFEVKFEYKLPDGFSEEQVVKPTSFLLDRFLRHLQNMPQSMNIEAETARLYLACCSYLDLN